MGIGASPYQFNTPDAMVLDGPDLFVANNAGSSTGERSWYGGSLLMTTERAAALGYP
jgi:hypothetical protein